MQRVVVLGSPGAGKSTLARQLGTRLTLPVTHLDERYWGPNWQPAEGAVWLAELSSLVEKPTWILDGNYTESLSVRLQRADTIIIFDVSRLVATFGVLRRWACGRKRCVQAPGCPEHFDPGFLRWVWRFRIDRQPILMTAIEKHAPHAELIVLRSRRDAVALLDRCEERVR